MQGVGCLMSDFKTWVDGANCTNGLLVPLTRVSIVGIIKVSLGKEV